MTKRLGSEEDQPAAFVVSIGPKEGYGVGYSVTAMLVPSVAVNLAPGERIATGKVLTRTPPSICHHAGAFIAPSGALASLTSRPDGGAAAERVRVHCAVSLFGAQ